MSSARLLALLTVAGFAAFLVMLIRFPQREGDPIKSSYLLFTAPAWAVFSVAAWTGLRRRNASLHVALAGVAVLYAISYGTELATILSRPSGRLPVGGSTGTIDLSTSIQASSTIYQGGDVVFAVWVENKGNQTANDVVLRVGIPSGLTLLGPPYFERGSGCVGTGTLTCKLDFVPGETGTPIRFELQAAEVGEHTITAAVSSSGRDVRPLNDESELSVFVVPPTTATTTSGSP